MKAISLMFLLLFFGVLFNVNHLFSILVVFEMLSLLIFFMVFVTSSTNIDFSMCMLIVVIMTSESIMGLVVFVLIVRHLSKDHINSVNLIKL